MFFQIEDMLFLWPTYQDDLLYQRVFHSKMETKAPIREVAMIKRKRFL